MGCAQSQESGEIDEDVQYQHKITLSVLHSSSPVGKQPRRDALHLSLPEPLIVVSESYPLNTLTVSMSGSVIPGFDPRHEEEKECQDGQVTVCADGQVLAALFDGHGKEGKKIVEFCCRFVKGYFLAHLKDFTESPMDAVERMFHDCDDKVKTQIQCDLSGS